VGDRVRVRPSGDTGQIKRVVQAADGRLTDESEFDAPGASGGRGSTGETGGLYVRDDIELVE
jgi:hypothetical protein